MDSLFEFGFYAFTSLITMINPLGVVPLYISLTRDLPDKETKEVAYKAVFTALLTLALFAFAGKFLFDFFGVSVNSLRVVGGIIFFMAGYDMLQARFVRTKEDHENPKDYGSDIAITPLAIPMISGPGSLTITIVLYNDAVDISQKAVLFGVIAIVLLITLVFLLSGKKIINKLGRDGNRLLMRIMGLILMVIAIELLFSGLKPILQDIFITN